MSAHTPGHAAYLEDCRRCPNYHDRTRRLAWHELDDIARWSWERNPTPRDYPSMDELDKRATEGGN